MLAVPAAHPWAKRQAVALQDLSDEPFILRESGSGTLRIMEEYLKQAGMTGIEGLHAVSRLGTSTAVKEGIKAGLGVSILSRRAIETELNAGILKALRLKGLVMSRHFYVIRDKRRIPSPLCQALMEHLMEASANEKPA